MKKNNLFVVLTVVALFTIVITAGAENKTLERAHADSGAMKQEMLMMRDFEKEENETSVTKPHGRISNIEVIHKGSAPAHNSAVFENAAVDANVMKAEQLAARKMFENLFEDAATNVNTMKAEQLAAKSRSHVSSIEVIHKGSAPAHNSADFENAAVDANVMRAEQLAARKMFENLFEDAATNVNTMKAEQLAAKSRSHVSSIEVIHKGSAPVHNSADFENAAVDANVMRAEQLAARKMFENLFEDAATNVNTMKAEQLAARERSKAQENHLKRK